jgi:hypothetical protein
MMWINQIPASPYSTDVVRAFTGTDLGLQIVNRSGPAYRRPSTAGVEVLCRITEVDRYILRVEAGK